MHPAPSHSNRWLKLVFTIFPLFVYTLADLVPLPQRGVTFFDVNWNGPAKYSIVSLGITPWFVAAALVEFATFVVPAWTPLRHDESKGRIKLQRAVTILGCLFAAFQAYWIANPFSSSKRGIDFAVNPSWEFYVPYFPATTLSKRSCKGAAFATSLTRCGTHPKNTHCSRRAKSA